MGGPLVVLGFSSATERDFPRTPRASIKKVFVRPKALLV